MCRSTRARPSCATWRKPDMPEAMGFFTDTTICIGCKACEVACKNWNQLPAENGGVRNREGGKDGNSRRCEGAHWPPMKMLQHIQGTYRCRWQTISRSCDHNHPARGITGCP